MSKKPAFSIEEVSNIFMVLDAAGRAVGSFSTRAEAERHVETATENARPRTARAQQQLADPEVPGAGRAASGATSQPSLFGPGQIAKAATKPAQPPAQPAAGEAPLTAREMERLLAGQQPKGRPGKTRAPSPTPPAKPPISKSPGPTIRTVQPLAHLAPKKGTGHRAQGTGKNAKSRRSKAVTGTVPIQSSERPGGGFVLENASTALTAGDLTRMLGQAPVNPAMAMAQTPRKPDRGIQPPPARETLAAKGSPPPVQRPLRVRPAPPPRPAKQPRQTVAGGAPAPTGRSADTILDRPQRVFTQRGRHENVADTIADLRHATRRPNRQPPPLQTAAAPAQSAGSQQAAPNSPRATRAPHATQPSGLVGVLKNLASTLASVAKALGGQQAGHGNATAGAGQRGKGQPGAAGQTGAAQPAKRGGLAGAVGNLLGRKPKQPHVGAGSAPAGVKAGLGSALGNVAGGAAMAAGGVGLVVGGLAKLGQQLVKAPLEIEAFTSGLLEGQRDLRQFNAGIANSFAMLERQQMVLAGRTASGTAGTTKALAESQGELRDSLQPLQELGRNLTNIAGTGLNKAANFLAQIAKSTLFIESINSYIASWMRDDNAPEVPQAARFVDDIARANWSAPKNQRP